MATRRVLALAVTLAATLTTHTSRAFVHEEPAHAAHVAPKDTGTGTGTGTLTVLPAATGPRTTPTTAPHAQAPESPSGGCGMKWPGVPGITETLLFATPDAVAGVINRTARVYVPRQYNLDRATPVVLDFHGYSSNAANQEEESGWRTIADQHGFIVVFPDGLDDTIGKLFGTDAQATSWNAVGTTRSPTDPGDGLGPTCKWIGEEDNGYACHATCVQRQACRDVYRAGGCDCSTCADDRQYVTDLLDYLEATFCVDKDRIHSTGMSNGGMMTYDLATQSEVATRIASIAPFASSPLLGFATPPLHPMAIMDIHGTEDDIIPANVSNGLGPGPHGSTTSSDGFYYTPTDTVMEKWASRNECSGEPYQYVTEYDGQTDLWCVAPYGRCSAGGPVVRCTHNLGHTWPFEEGERSKAALLAWDFFSKNPRWKAAADPAKAIM